MLPLLIWIAISILAAAAIGGAVFTWSLAKHVDGLERQLLAEASANRRDMHATVEKHVSNRIEYLHDQLGSIENRYDTLYNKLAERIERR